MSEDRPAPGDAELDLRRRQRARLLRRIYERSRADVATFLDGYELADELGLPHDEAGRIIRYFEELGFVKHIGGGGLTIRITAAGIDHIETRSGGHDRGD